MNHKRSVPGRLLRFASRGCPSLTLPQKIRYAPFLAQLVVTRRCNLSCSYCNEFDTSSAPVAMPALEACLDKLASLGTFGLQFTGGEPLLHPELTALVGSATRRGFPKRMLISNCLLLDETRIEALNQAGLTHLQVSVDGVHGAGRSEKVLERMHSRLELLAGSARFHVTLSAVVGSAPAAEVLGVLAFARRLGFRPRILLQHGQDGGVHGLEAWRPAGAELREAVGCRYDEAGRYRRRLLAGQPAPFKCRAGARYLYVDERGTVHWCSPQRQRFAKPLRDYSPADLREQFHRAKPCSEYCGVGCARTASAWDEWRGQKRS